MVENFLIQQKNSWTDFNVPFTDGRELEKLILENNCKTVLEIGTSSGHSTIWLAKAVAKTGGNVTTIEIDKTRFQKARRNFKTAGVLSFIKMKFGDAMQIIPTLNGPFDFVFSDATWMTKPKEGDLEFFVATEPKLTIGSLFTMHNVTDGYGDDGMFFTHINSTGKYETKIIQVTHNGISVSKKIK